MMKSMIDYELDNGMKVLLLPSKSAPVVACNVWVGVGSADETPQEAGLAHVHEHMLFKGTERRGVGEIAREVESAGGHINAFTSFDQTCYYVVMSSRFMETGLDILSDAIRHSSFDADELERELEVIQEEIKRGDDSPSRVASLKLFATAFAHHPYRLPVIGTKESVDSFRREHVLAFFEKHYVPDNMTVVLAGDFEESEARALVDRFFGDFSRRGEGYSPIERPQEPSQQEMRIAIAQEGRQDTHLRIGFHVPPATHDDIPALEMLGVIMGSGEASTLYEKVLYEKELVNGLYAGSYTPREAGLFMISADYQIVGDDEPGAPGARSHEEVLEAIMQEVFAFCFAQASEEQLARARTILESQAIYSKQTVEGLAMKLGQFDMVTGDPLYEEKYYERLGRVDAEEIMAVAKKYLTPENMSVVLSHREEDGGEQPDRIEAIVRRVYQAAGERDEVSVKPAHPPLVPPEEGDQVAPKASTYAHLEPDEYGFVAHRLESGPLVLVQENHHVELFSVRALTLGGLRMETPRSNGINAILSELVTRGTSARSSVEIARDMESMAASIAGISGRNTFGMSLTGLSQFFAPSLTLFGECLLDATIPEEEFERVRRLQLQDIRSRQDQLGAVNYELFASRFFEGHPYAMSTSGTPESLEQMTPEDLREYLSVMTNPEGLVIVVVGDVDSAECIARFDEMFSHVESTTSDLTPKLIAPKHRGRELVTTDLEKNQSHIIVGFDAPTIESDDRFALEILHAVLSGQGGRLFYELRDKQSLAYSVYASMLLGVEASAFAVNIGTSPEKIDQAIEGMVGEVRRLSEEPPTKEEIASAKRYLIGNHDIGLQRNSARAMSVALDELYGLGRGRSFEYGDRIDAVTSEQIGAVVERYLRLEDILVSVAKPAATSVSEEILEV